MAGRPFEHRKEAEVPASPEEVWAAIATGPGIDSWFMGRNSVQPGPGGTVRTEFGDYAPELEITAWDPLRRFGYRSGQAPDGRFIAYEFLIEGRAGGSTVLRAVTSGFIPGEGWDDEYEAMALGGDLYFRTLVEYLGWFRGRFATPVTAFGPPGTSWERDRRLIFAALGLRGGGAVGGRVQFAAAESGTAEGVLYFVNPRTIGVRTPGGLYRFLRGFGKPVVASHQRFGEGIDPARAGRAWESWLARVLGEKEH